MYRNEKFAALCAVAAAGLTILTSLASSMGVGIAGSLLLIAIFAVAACFEKFWGPPQPKRSYYLLPMMAGPAVGTLVHGSSIAVPVGLAAGVLAAAATIWLVLKFPLYLDPESTGGPASSATGPRR